MSGSEERDAAQGQTEELGQPDRTVANTYREGTKGRDSALDAVRKARQRSAKSSNGKPQQPYDTPVVEPADESLQENVRRRQEEQERRRTSTIVNQVADEDEGDEDTDEDLDQEPEDALKAVGIDLEAIKELSKRLEGAAGGDQQTRAEPTAQQNVTQPTAPQQTATQGTRRDGPATPKLFMSDEELGQLAGYLPEYATEAIKGQQTLLREMAQALAEIVQEREQNRLKAFQKAAQRAEGFFDELAGMGVASLSKSNGSAARERALRNFAAIWQQTGYDEDSIESAIQLAAMTADPDGVHKAILAKVRNGIRQSVSKRSRLIDAVSTRGVSHGEKEPTGRDGALEMIRSGKWQNRRLRSQRGMT